MLQRFESFVPKNIEKRKEDLKKIKEKEAKELNVLAMKLSEIVKGFKNLKVEDEKEKFFIDKFVYCQIKVDHNKYPNIVFFFDQKDNYLGEYDSKNQEFWVSYSQIRSILESKYSLNYNQIKPLTESWVEEHFKLRPVTIQALELYVTAEVEEHFKLRPVTI